MKPSGSWGLVAAFLVISCGQSDSGASEGCEPGQTRECVGPAACKGGQLCDANRAWGVCNCGGSGTGGQSGGGGTGANTACPTNLPGPPMVEVSAPAGGSYCIDATEATREHYAAFVAANPDPSAAQTGSCKDANKQWIREDCWPGGFDATPSDYPMLCVDYCDAKAYCEWAGKRLCGRIGGGTLVGNEYADPNVSERFNACSLGGTLAFPYGQVYSDKCATSLTVVPVGNPECAGPLPGLFDMATGAWDWIDSCDPCKAVGGSIDSPTSLPLSKPACAGYLSITPNQQLPDQPPYMTGIRCCHD